MKEMSGERPRQQCRKCRGWFDREVAFRKNPLARRAAITAQPFRAVCIGCEQTGRDGRKAVDPFISKARSTIRTHSHKYDLKPGDFIRLYGWDVQRVAHVMRHAFDNTCTYCRHPYSGMRNGPAAVTMDILDPRKPPHLETNTLPCCQTCNSAKSNLTPEAWSEKLRFWSAWEKHQRLRPRAVTQLAFNL